MNDECDSKQTPDIARHSIDIDGAALTGTQMERRKPDPGTGRKQEGNEMTRNPGKGALTLGLNFADLWAGSYQLCVAALMACGAASASASALTFALTGHVYSVSASISDVFFVGDDVSGSYTFESGTAGVTHPIGSVDPSPSAGTVTSFDGALTAFEIRIGSYSLGLSGRNRIVITKDELDAPLSPLIDRYILELLSPTGTSVNGLPTSEFFLDWESPAPTALAARALPITTLFGAFPISAGALDFVDGQTALNRVTFAIESVTLASVPEPSSLFLGCLGVAAIGMLRRRRIGTEDGLERR